MIAESDIDLNNLEQLDEEKISDEALKIRKLMEEYANGGFDILRSKLEENPEFDNNELRFIDLLDEKFHTN